MWFGQFIFKKSANCSNQVSSYFFLSILMNSAYSYIVTSKRKISQKVIQIDTARSQYFSQWESIMLSTSWEVGGPFQKLYFVRDLTTIPIKVVFAMSCTNSNSLSKSISVPYIMSRNWVLFSEFNWHQIHPIKFYCLFYLL